MASTALEILIRAKNETDAAFKAVVKQLEATGKEAKKTNDILGDLSKDLKKQFGDALEGMGGNLGRVGQALQALGPGGMAAAAGIGAAAAALGVAVKVATDAALAAAAYGDKIADLSSKTDLSTKSLQAFDVMARTGNTSVEAISAGVLKMQRGLVEGSSAFRRLGLDINELKQMSPEEQFRAVAVAIEGLGTNAERSAARVAVFGKSGDELTTVLHEAATGATELGGALSDEAIQATADLQDKVDLLKTAWERVILQFGAAIAQSPQVGDAIDLITDAIIRSAEFIGKYGPLVAEVFEGILGNVKRTMIGLEAVVRAGTIGPVEAFKEMKAKIEALELDELFSDVKSGASTNQQKRSFGPSDKDIAAYNKLAEERRKALEEESKLFQKVAQQWDAFYKTLFKEEAALTKWIQTQAQAREKARAQELLDGLERQRQSVEDQRKVNALAWAEKKRQYQEEQEAARQLREDLASGAEMLAGLFQDFGLSGEHALVKIFEGFAAGTRAALQFASATNVAQKAMAAMGAAQSALNSGSVAGGAMTGAAFGAQFGILGAGIGAVGGALLGFFGKAKKAREEMRQLRDEFVKSAGGMDALKKQAAAAGISLDGLFKQKSAKALADQIDVIKGKLQDWDEAQKILKEGMDRYGISVSDMGSRFAALELDKQAREMALFFAAAIQVGANASAVTAGMKDEVLALVAQYQAAGLAIPAALRPILEAMLKNGDLVKENGEAYGSLEEAGFQFAETMEGALSRIGDEINKLMRVLAQGFNIPINFEVSGSPSAPGVPGGPRPPRDEEVPEFAQGGHTGNGSAAFMAKLHPRETVVPDDKMAGFLAQAFAMAGAQMGGANMGGTVVVPVSISNRQFGQVTADVSRRRQGRINPSGVRRF